MDMLEMHDQSNKLMVERLSHQVIWQAEKQWHTDMLYELHGNRMTLCGLSASQTVQSAGPQTVKGTEQQFTWRGMFPGVTFILSSNFWGSAEAPSHCKPHLRKMLLNT